MATDQTPIPTNPKEVYETLRRLLDSAHLTIPESAAVAYAMGIMQSALPSSFPKKES